MEDILAALDTLDGVCLLVGFYVRAKEEEGHAEKAAGILRLVNRMTAALGENGKRDKRRRRLESSWGQKKRRKLVRAGQWWELRYGGGQA